MHAVITGDIINSQRMLAGNWIDVLTTILSAYGTSPEKWEIFRGDSFQLLLTDPEESLLTAIRIKASLKTSKERDARMSIGIGTVDYLADRVSLSNGEAFVRSGKQFDRLREQKVTLAVNSPWSDFDNEMNLCIRFASLVMDDWTEGTAEYMNEQLRDPSQNQKELAKKLGIGQSSVSERKTRSHYSDLMQLEKRFRTRIAGLL